MSILSASPTPQKETERRISGQQLPQGDNKDVDGLMRILVIEDDRDAADYLIKGLRESGYSVDHALGWE